MISEEDDFFEFNTHRINRLVSIIFMFLNVLIPVLGFLTYKGIFQIDAKFLWNAEFIILPFSIVNISIVFGFSSNKFRLMYPQHYEILQHIAKYFGLIGTSLVLSFMGTHAHVGIYISYALIVFISCLYYSVRTTTIIAILDYICMILSLYGKSMNRVAEGMTPNSALKDCFAFAAGFTLEFLFVVFVAIKIAQKNNKTLHSAIDRNEKLQKNQLDFMKFIPVVLKKHEIITGCHVEHTVEYVRMICNQLKAKGLYTEQLTPANIELFSAAANLHDVGKIYIPDHILNCPRKYTPEEYAMMKRHPEIGAEIIEAMPEVSDGVFNEVAAQMCLCHHERWDGNGYPNGLKGEDIPLCARIMAVADVTDALLSFRPYKPPFTMEKAMQIIEEGKGTQFQPEIADAIIDVQSLVWMYANDRSTSEKESIEREIKWREQERDSLISGRTISIEQEKELEHNI